MSSVPATMNSANDYYLCVWGRSNLRMAESIYPIGAHLRVLAGNREIVRIPRRTKDFHHELVQTR